MAKYGWQFGLPMHTLKTLNSTCSTQFSYCMCSTQVHATLNWQWVSSELCETDKCVWWQWQRLKEGA
jgi:hypothetical protein